MNKIRSGLIGVIIICALWGCFFPSLALANSAEPPAMVILVNNPPEELSIELVSGDHHPEATFRKVAWEGYYAFYLRDMHSGSKHTFQVMLNGESFECSIDAPSQRYNSVYTLDLTSRELTYGTYPFRSVILVSMRMLLTLFLEGIVFWLFGFRQQKSWLAFLAVNAVTQGALNIWLNSSGSLMPSYLIFALIFGEIFVLITEMVTFPILIKEHKKSRILIYVFMANLISLVAGGYIISVLPV